MAEGQKRKIRLTTWRRASQAVFLLLFLFLFRKTDYGGADEIPYAVNIFFRWNPLVAATAMIAARAFISLLIPAIAVLILTALFGRFFCGWVCPLGTCLDMTRKIVPAVSSGEKRKYRSYKYYLLAFLLILSVFGVSIVGYFDPFSILIRGLTVGIDPALSAAVRHPFDYLYQHGAGWMTAMSEPIYSALKKTVLPFRQNVFALVFPNLLILVGVFALERLERRFWCRNLCPLGAMLGIFSRFPLLRLHPGKACKADGCDTCAEICRMRAIDGDGLVSPESCNLCLDCLEGCPKGIVTFKFKRPKHKPAPFDMGRRGMIGAAASGLFLPAFLKARSVSKVPDPFLIRPPGSLNESEFLARCVRCGECMKVCIGNALQPTGLQAGIEGVFSPVLTPRIGYCEFNCTLCGQVCPTGAIKKLKKEEKQKVKVGLAYFDRNRCLPWAKAIPCLVCEEMCPTPDKAIKLREEKAINPLGEEITVQRPYVVDDLCIGCGVCENKCPLPGRAAVIVTSENESRKPQAYY